jgi:uncharacterized protein with PIN domain
MTVASCPHCSESVARITLEPITAVGPKGGEIRALALVCPSCTKILSVSLHPKASAAMAAPARRDDS